MAKPFKPYGHPPPFDLDEYKDDFETWEDHWTRYLRLSTINEIVPAIEQPRYKADMLMTCLSQTTFKIIKSSGLTAEQLRDPAEIIEALKTRCNAGKNKNVWRVQFTQRKQQKGESFDDWLCDLRALSQKCEFAKNCCALCETARMLDQILAGVYSEEHRCKLFEKGDTLSYNEAVTLLRTLENAANQSTSIVSGGLTSIQQMKKSSYKKEKSSSSKPNPPQGKPANKAHHNPKTGSNRQAKCRNCGAATQHKKEDCPAQGKECHACGKANHYASVCLSKNKPKIAAMADHRLGSISNRTIATVKRDEMVKLSVLPALGDAAESLFLPDTGAEIDAIPETAYYELFKNTPLASAPAPVSATGSRIASKGTFKANIRWRVNDGTTRTTPATIHVLKDLTQPVLGKTSQQKLGMLPTGYPHAIAKLVKHDQSKTDQSPSQTNKVLQSSSGPYNNPFSSLLARNVPSHTVVAALKPSAPPNRAQDLSKLMSEFPAIFDGQCRPMVGPLCHFKLKDNATPVSMRGNRPVAEPLKPLLQAELNALEQQGIIKKTDEATPWVHPIVTVRKKDGNIRLCVDFRELNKCIVRPRF